MQLPSGGQGGFICPGAGTISSNVLSYNCFGFGAGAISSNVSNFNLPNFNFGSVSGAKFSGLPWQYPTNNSSIDPTSQANNSGRPTLLVPPSPSKVGATRLIPIQMLTSPAPQSSPVVQPRTGLRHVSTPSPTVSPTHSPAVSPTPHYSPVSPPLVGQRAGSVSRIQSWSNNTVTGTSLPSQITPAAHPVVGSCQVSFGSRAVRPGQQNNSVLNSTPASPSLSSSSSPSSPSSVSSPASSPPAKAPPHGHASTSSRKRSAISHSSPSAQHTPAAPLFPSLGGLNSQSSSTSAYSLVMRSASGARTSAYSLLMQTASGAPTLQSRVHSTSMTGTLSQASQSSHSSLLHPFLSSVVAPTQRSMWSMSSMMAKHRNLSQASQSQSSHQLQSSQLQQSQFATPASLHQPSMSTLVRGTVALNVPVLPNSNVSSGGAHQRSSASSSSTIAKPRTLTQVLHSAHSSAAASAQRSRGSTSTASATAPSTGSLSQFGLYEFIV